MKYQCKKRLELFFHLSVGILTFVLMFWLGSFFYRHVERDEFPGWVYLLFAAYVVVVLAIDSLITRSDPEPEAQGNKEFLQ